MNFKDGEFDDASWTDADDEAYGKMCENSDTQDAATKRIGLLESMVSRLAYRLLALGDVRQLELIEDAYALLKAEEVEASSESKDGGP